MLKRKISLVKQMKKQKWSNSSLQTVIAVIENQHLMEKLTKKIVHAMGSLDRSNHQVIRIDTGKV